MSQRNLASSDAWNHSLTRSRTRRAAAIRAARARMRTRGGAVSVAALVLLGGAAAPLALGHGDGASASASAGLTRAGDSGSTVSAVQSALGVPADGVYGPVTKAAVTDFQGANGLLVDGIVGPETLAALGIGNGAAPTHSAGGAGEAAATPGSNGGSGDGSSPSSDSSGGGGAVPSALDQIAQCESGGDPNATNGAYRGKYQFSRETWQGVGGSGDPAAASESEQDKRATTLYRQQGSSPWANCG